MMTALPTCCTHAHTEAHTRWQPQGMSSIWNSWHISNVLEQTHKPSLPARPTATGQLQKGLFCCLILPQSQLELETESKPNHNMCIVPWWQMNLQLILRRPVGEGQEQSKTRFLLVSMQKTADPKELFYWPYNIYLCVCNKYLCVCWCVYLHLLPRQLDAGCAANPRIVPCHYFSYVLIKANSTQIHRHTHTPIYICSHVVLYCIIMMCSCLSTVCAPFPSTKHQH